MDKDTRTERMRRAMIVLGCLITAVATVGLGYVLYGYFAEGRRLSTAMVLTFVATALSGICLTASVIRHPPKSGARDERPHETDARKGRNPYNDGQDTSGKDGHAGKSR